MYKKQIHVKSFTKKDGTQVRSYTKKIDKKEQLRQKYDNLIKMVSEYDLNKLEPGSSLEFSVFKIPAIYDSSTGKPIQIDDDIAF